MQQSTEEWPSQLVISFVGGKRTNEPPEESPQSNSFVRKRNEGERWPPWPSTVVGIYLKKPTRLEWFRASLNSLSLTKAIGHLCVSLVFLHNAKETQENKEKKKPSGIPFSFCALNSTAVYYCNISAHKSQRIGSNSWLNTAKSIIRHRDVGRGKSIFLFLSLSLFYFWILWLFPLRAAVQAAHLISLRYARQSSHSPDCGRRIRHATKRDGKVTHRHQQRYNCKNANVCINCPLDEKIRTAADGRLAGWLLLASIFPVRQTNPKGVDKYNNSNLKLFKKWRKGGTILWYTSLGNSWFAWDSVSNIHLI